MAVDLQKVAGVSGYPGYILVMGVSGVGKSTIGKALSLELGGKFVEADDLHPAENVRRMSSGLPLTDLHRWPWLKAVSDASLSEMDCSGGPIIIGCSALKRSYRNFLRKTLKPLSIVHLSGSAEIIRPRLESRLSHFMPAELLGSQLAILEPPEPDESGHSVSIDVTEEAVVEQALSFLRPACGVNDASGDERENYGVSHEH